MRHRGVWTLLGAACLAAGCLSATKREGDTARAADDRRLIAEQVIEGWPQGSALAAHRTMERYGPPDTVRSGRLVWESLGPWKRIIVRDVMPPYAGPPADMGLIEQTILYPMTPEQASNVRAFDDKLSVNARRGELSSRSEREELNFLSLNLADDVVQGRLTGAQARDLYSNILSLEESGKSSPYMMGLRFAVPRWR